MIQKMEVSGIHMKIDDDLRKYVTKKIGKLDQYMSKHARKSAHAEVKLKENKIKNKQEYICEVVLFLPHDTINTKESTVNMFAAIDIVEAKLKNQLRKYKETHANPRIHRRLIIRLRRRIRQT